MTIFDDIVDSVTDYQDVDEEFYEERLARYEGDRARWATAIDTAAYDVADDVAIGSTDSSRDIGGTIGKADFPRATGSYYVEGLRELVDENSQVEDVLQQYDDDDVGRLVLKLTELRVRLQSATSSELTAESLSRTLEALVEKLTTKEVESGALRQPLRETEAVVDMLVQLLSDPTAEEYTDVLVGELARAAGNESILQLVDEPQLTTPLWDHQVKALRKWLGLAAIAQRFDGLHPANEAEELSPDSLAPPDGDLDVLIAAGRNLLLDQWRDEFETHVNVPKHRTEAHETGNGRTIGLSWGTVEFQTSQQLANDDVVGRYDLVILDEAHRYSKGSSSNRGWRDVFEQLTDKSEAILAMSGSIDAGWIGDETVESVLDDRLDEVYTFSLSEAKSRGVVADFSWHVSYVPAAEDDSVRHLVDVTETCSQYFGSPSGPDLTSLDGTVAGAGVWTLGDLRAFSNSSEGRELRDESAAFDTLANAAFSRLTRRWQLGPSVDTIVEILRDHSDEQAVVLVQSYAFAAEVKSAIEADFASVDVAALSDRSEEPQETISRFNDGEASVLVGPGELLGTGVDLPDAEVAINVGKGGLNPSLVQRIGRVLRNPSGDKNATFYHLVSVPTDSQAVIATEDGRRFIERICSFGTLGERMGEPPVFECRDDDLLEILSSFESNAVESYAELPYDVDDLVDSAETATAVEELCEAVESSDATVTSFQWAGQSSATNESEAAFAQQSEESEHDEDTEMITDGERDEIETSDADLEVDLATEDVERVEEVAEREPIPDDELIAFWELDSPIELAQIVKGELEDCLTRDKAGDVCTTELGRHLVNGKPAGDEFERGDSESAGTEVNSDGANSEDTDADADGTDNSQPRIEKTASTDDTGSTTRQPAVGAYLEPSPDDVVERVQSEFGVNETIAQRLLDLYEADGPVDVDELVDGWEFDGAPDIYKYTNNSMSGLARVVGIGDVKLSRDARDQIETLYDVDTDTPSDTTTDTSSSADDSDTEGDGRDDRMEIEDERTERRVDERSVPDHYSEGLLETNREKLTEELQESSDHALYPPTEETVIKESHFPFGSYIYTFGSFEDALRAAGFRIKDQVLIEDSDREFRPSEIVAAVQAVADILGDLPTEALFYDLVPMTSSDTEILGTWRQIVTEAGLETDHLSRADDLSDVPDHDELTAAIAALVAETERPPSVADIAEYCDVPVYHLVEAVNSWSDIVEIVARANPEEDDTVASFDPSSAATSRFVEAVVEENPTIHPTVGVLAALPDVNVGRVINSQSLSSFPKLVETPVDVEPERDGDEDDTDERETDDGPESDDNEGEADSESEETDDDDRFIIDGRVRPEYEVDQRDALTDDLRRLKREFGHPPRPVDVENYGRFSPSEYVDVFGTWDNVLESANLEFRDAWGHPTDYDDKLLSTLEDLTDEVGHRPTTRNVDELTDYTAATYVSRFGSMDAAIREVDLESSSPAWAREIVEEISESWGPLGNFRTAEDRRRAGIEALLLLRRGWRGTGHEIVNEVGDRLDVDKPSYRNAWEETIRPVLREAEDRNHVLQNEGTWIWEWRDSDQ
jgi:superfamily II DNA or RNA helicase